MNIRNLSSVCFNKAVLIVAICLCILQVTSVQAAERCEAFFNDQSYSILKQGPLSKIKAYWGSSHGQINKDVVLKRYEQNFKLIFSDISPDFLSKARFKFIKDMDHGLAETDLMSSEIRFLKKLKNHWLFPILHAHELQHYFDIQAGKIPFEVERTGWLSREIHVDYEAVLRSEVRAHYRHWRALKLIVSESEIKELMRAETDPQVLKFLTEYLDFGGRAMNYIGMVLQQGYSVTISKAFYASRQTDKSLYLFKIIEDEILKDEFE